MRRSVLVAAGAAALVVAVAAGGYVYLVVENRDAPPPLTLDSAVAGSAVPDGVWTSADGGRLEIVGGWIESGRLPGGARVDGPVDLTSLAPNRPAHVAPGRGVDLDVVWSPPALRLDGTVDGERLHAVYRRSAAGR